MSEEEKKAIFAIKLTIDQLKYDADSITTDIIGIQRKTLKMLLSLIEKQQKEIEELKKPKYLAHFENNKITKIELINDFISKDKIREKIKEKENRIKQMHFGSDAVIIDDLENQIDCYKELLDE